MKFEKIRCDNCGADLEVDLSKGYAYCQYCGNKLYADYSDNLLIEKEKTKQKIYELRKEIEKTKRIDSAFISTQKIEEIEKWITGMTIVLYFLLFILIWTIYGFLISI